MDKELNEFGNPYPTLSEMVDKYDELYRGTLSYQLLVLRMSFTVLGKEIISAPLNVFEAIANTLGSYISPIIEWLDTPLTEKSRVETVSDYFFRNTVFHQEACDVLAKYCEGQPHLVQFVVEQSNRGYELHEIIGAFTEMGIVGFYMKENTELASRLLTKKQLVKTPDGMILEVVDAPPLEFLEKRKNS